jgi:hypothetical protein
MLLVMADTCPSRRVDAMPSPEARTRWLSQPKQNAPQHRVVASHT